MPTQLIINEGYYLYKGNIYFSYGTQKSVLYKNSNGDWIKSVIYYPYKEKIDFDTIYVREISDFISKFTKTEI